MAKVIGGAVTGFAAGAVIAYFVGVAIFEHSFVFPPPYEPVPYILFPVLGTILGGLIAARHLSIATQRGLKYAWLAPLLNIFPYPLGFGYLYLGRLRMFILAFVVGLIAGVVGFLGAVIAALGGGSDLEFVVAIAWPMVLVAAVTAWHGWRLAERHNASAAHELQEDSE